MSYLNPAPVISIVRDASGAALRRLSPYLYSFNTPVKARWMNRTVLDVVTSEFSRLGNHNVVTRMIREGHVRVSSKFVAPDYKLRGHDRLQTTVVRHDPDILADPIAVVYESNEVVAVDKPPSIPIHANARYVHNTLVSILAEQNPAEYSQLRVIHRLDAMTQGLVILAKTSSSAASLCAALREGNAQKMYFARVVGHLAQDEIHVTDSLDHTLPSRQHKPTQEAATLVRTLWRGHLGNGKYPVSLVQCTRAYHWHPPVPLTHCSPAKNH
ncbi:pseudouridine synthase [Catenaria anguillulae PL171]|uniref:Pseudouridine synthase n=1 Tax=Catenaria anguillulae PL171 TaxID=765915 RepID=A0A1Y2HXZ7_9FUNG|nr:pseudouridine synthase [Catenaria anguillulae PL171]